MIPRKNPCNKRQKVPVLSDSPHECSEAVTVAGTSVIGQSLKGQRSGIGCDAVTVAGTNVTGHSLMRQSSDALKVAVTSDTRENVMGSEDNRCDRKQRVERQKNLLPVMRHKHNRPDVLTPRQKVLKALNIFEIVYEELSRNKSACFATTKRARDIHVRDWKQATEKRVGVVPGVDVGDVFRYKAQLSVVGLHFNMSTGIDYMYWKGLKIATSVVISEGAAYEDICRSDTVTCCGQGDYMKTKSLKAAKDQTMRKGNLALANSLREKTLVRVIIGRLEQGIKQYVYAGLFSVQKYWDEKGPLGNNVFKFELLRLPGQGFN